MRTMFCILKHYIYCHDFPQQKHFLRSVGRFSDILRQGLYTTVMSPTTAAFQLTKQDHAGHANMMWSASTSPQIASSSSRAFSFGFSIALNPAVPSVRIDLRKVICPWKVVCQNLVWNRSEYFRFGYNFAVRKSFFDHYSSLICVHNITRYTMYHIFSIAWGSLLFERSKAEPHAREFCLERHHRAEISVNRGIR